MTAEESPQVNTSWQQHELLHCQFVACVAASVNHVERWNW